LFSNGSPRERRFSPEMRLMLNPQRQRVDARRANRVTAERGVRMDSGDFRVAGNDPRNDALNRTASITKQMFARDPALADYMDYAEKQPLRTESDISHSF